MKNDDPYQSLIADHLSGLEVEWTSYEWGRFHHDGIQHTFRDGSVVVVTMDGPDEWLVGFYTPEQHADCELHADALIYRAESSEEVVGMVLR